MTVARVTTTEYETVERTVRQYECDECGHVMPDDSELTTVAMAPGDVHIEQPPVYNGPGIADDVDVTHRHLCESCSGLRTAIHLDRQVSLIRERWDATTGKAALISAALFFALGVTSTVVLPWIGAGVGTVASVLPWWMWAVIGIVIVLLTAGDE